MISNISYYLFLRIIVVYYYKFLCVESLWPKRPPITSARSTNIHQDTPRQCSLMTGWPDGFLCCSAHLSHSLIVLVSSGRSAVAFKWQCIIAQLSKASGKIPHTTQFQIEGGGVVQRVTKLITTCSASLTWNKKYANHVDKKWGSFFIFRK